MDIRKLFVRKFNPKRELLEEIEGQKKIAYFYRVEADYQQKLGEALMSKKDRKRYEYLDTWFRENQNKNKETKEWKEKRDEFRKLNEMIQLSDQVLGWAAERRQKIMITDGYVQYLEALYRNSNPKIEAGKNE